MWRRSRKYIGVCRTIEEKEEEDNDDDDDDDDLISAEHHKSSPYVLSIPTIRLLVCFPQCLPA